MFKKSKSKSNIFIGSKESLSGSGTFASRSSNESVAGSGSRDLLMLEPTNLLYRVTQFELHFLGMVQDVNMSTVHQRNPNVHFIDKVEEAQIEGKIRLIAKEEDLVTLTISKHGLTVLDKDKKEVQQRHPLHNVAQAVYYIDSFMKSNVALKVGQVGRSVYDCYVFQCHTEEQAQSVCQSLKGVFDIVTTRG